MDVVIGLATGSSPLPTYERLFNSLDEVPRHVVTQGLGTISDARHLVMLATGESKARPIAQMIEGPVSASSPASALQLHPDVTVLIDDAADDEPVHAGHYCETYRHKPSWQQL